jgi:hypothetical protein
MLSGQFPWQQKAAEMARLITADNAYFSEVI